MENNNTFACPHCGAPVRVIPEETLLSGADPDKMELLAQAIGLPQPAMYRRPDGIANRTAYRPVPGVGAVAGAMIPEQWTEAYFQQPARNPSVAGDVIVPLYQSLASGAMAGVLVAIPTLAWSWPWTVPAVSTVVVTAAVWAWRLVDLVDLLRKVERWTNTDLDGDGKIGKAEPQRVTVETLHKDAQGNIERITYDDITADEDQLRALAWGLLMERRPFSRREWTAAPHKVFSPDQFTTLQDEMIDGGLLSPKGSGANAGYKLSLTGRKFLGQYLPHPEAVVGGGMPPRIPPTPPTTTERSAE
jgi:hypothetical protein